MVRPRALFSLLVLATACAAARVEPASAGPEPEATKTEPPATKAAETAEDTPPAPAPAPTSLGQIGTGLHAPKPIIEVALTGAEADLEVRGQVDRAAVWRELQAHQVDLETCCRDLLSGDLSAGGQAKIAFVIGESGAATNLHVSELDDASGSPHSDARPTLAACVGKAASTWAFPPPTAGLATVAYRFGFAPAPAPSPSPSPSPSPAP